MNVSELAGLGAIVKEVEVFAGLVVKFHSLTVKEEIAVSNAVGAGPQDLVSRSGILQLETLTNSIEKIGDKTFTDQKELREYLMGLQRHILTHMWNVWEKHFDKASEDKISTLKKN